MAFLLKLRLLILKEWCRRESSSGDPTGYCCQHWAGLGGALLPFNTSAFMGLLKKPTALPWSKDGTFKSEFIKVQGNKTNKEPHKMVTRCGRCSKDDFPSRRGSILAFTTPEYSLASLLFRVGLGPGGLPCAWDRIPNSVSFLRACLFHRQLILGMNAVLGSCLPSSPSRQEWDLFLRPNRLTK